MAESERTRSRDSFPRQWARTQRFSLGLPRSFTIAPDGSRIAFLRSLSGDDPRTGLWVLDLPEARERLAFDPRAHEEDETGLPPEERARRERTRERAAGVVAYTTDRAVTVATFSVGGALRLVDLRYGTEREVPATPSVFDPRIDPTGNRIGYVTGGALRVAEIDGENRLLASEDEPDVSWGVAEFVAAEEMNRREGFWWSPDGSRLAAARVDERHVTTATIFDPIDPQAEPRTVRYPFAGTPNADVTLWILGLDGSRTEVRWDRERFEYLVRVVWDQGRPLTLLVQSRDQRTTQTLAVDDEGSTRLLQEATDDAWVENVEGSPAWTTDGHLVSTTDDQDTRRLGVGDGTVTPKGLQIHRILDVGDGVLFVGTEEPTEEHVWRWSADGQLRRLTEAPGVHTATGEGDVTVITSATLEGAPSTTILVKDERVGSIASHVEEPLVEAKPILFTGGARELRAALLLPGGKEPDGQLPVLLDPYGGPLFQRVTKTRDQFLESQWFADQGFAVLVADGRGSPGRGTAWEKAVHGDLAGPPLEDQVDALQAAAERFPFLDLSRVAIRGWSFGGFLSAAAVLRRADVFHAAVVGAPVTDERLYDTHYNERYLGHPDEHPEAYRRSSVLDDAPGLERPMLIVHGLADDNCFVANSLLLVRALLEAGKPHTFVPLSGATHMAKEESVAENLLLLQLRFLRDALGLERGPAPG